MDEVKESAVEFKEFTVEQQKKLFGCLNATHPLLVRTLNLLDYLNNTPIIPGNMKNDSKQLQEDVFQWVFSFEEEMNKRKNRRTNECTYQKKE
jgi:hypothetical protein